MQIPLSAGIRQNRSKRYMTVVWCILLAFLLSAGGCSLVKIEEGERTPLEYTVRWKDLEGGLLLASVHLKCPHHLLFYSREVRLSQIKPEIFTSGIADAKVRLTGLLKLCHLQVSRWIIIQSYSSIEQQVFVNTGLLIHLRI